MPCGRQVEAPAVVLGVPAETRGVRRRHEAAAVAQPQVGVKSCVPSRAAPSDAAGVTFPLASIRLTMSPYRWKLSDGSSTNDDASMRAKAAAAEAGPGPSTTVVAPRSTDATTASRRRPRDYCDMYRTFDQASAW